MRKRVVKTVDDAARAIAELQPDGFTIYFEFARGLTRDGAGRTSELIEYHVWGWKDGGASRDWPRLTAHSPADIVRKFIAEFLPLARPKPPPPIRGHVNGRRQPRLEYEPMQPFRAGEIG